MVVDAHAHICWGVSGMVAAGFTRGAGYGRVQIGDDTIQAWPPLCSETHHTAEMLLAHMDWVGVDKAVLLQGPFYGGCNEYVQEAVKRWEGRLIGAAFLDPWGENGFEQLLDIIDSRSFRAVKLECSVATGFCGIHPAARLDDASIDWLWRETEAAGFVVTLDLGEVGSRSYQTGALRRIAERHERLKIVVAHLGQPSPALDEDAGKRRLWEEQIDLGDMPNVWFDTASMPAYFSHERFPFPSVGRYMQEAIERVGSEKILWGTDIPGLLAHTTYQQSLELARDHLAFLSADEYLNVMGRNALNVYGG